MCRPHLRAIMKNKFNADMSSLGDITPGRDRRENSMIYYDHLPLDRDILKALDGDVKNLVLGFHSRGILVVAEGVEEKEEFDYLVGLGVDLYQGYYLARPA